MSTEVFDVGDEICDLVNDPRRRQRLMQNNALWSHLCVCVDVISDTEQAIRGYLAQTTTDHDILYLNTYGVLQAFVTQQDAVAHLAVALGHPIDGWAPTNPTTREVPSGDGNSTTRGRLFERRVAVRQALRAATAQDRQTEAEEDDRDEPDARVEPAQPEARRVDDDERRERRDA